MRELLSVIQSVCSKFSVSKHCPFIPPSPSSTTFEHAGVVYFLSIITMSTQPKYEDVQMDERDDSSITEVEESLLGDEKLMSAEEFRQRYARKSKRTTCLSILKEARWFLDIGLLLIIIALLLRTQSQNFVPKTSENEVGGDMTGVGPHCTAFPNFS